MTVSDLVNKLTSLPKPVDSYTTVLIEVKGEVKGIDVIEVTEMPINDDNAEEVIVLR